MCFSQQSHVYYVVLMGCSQFLRATTTTECQNVTHSSRPSWRLVFLLMRNTVLQNNHNIYIFSDTSFLIQKVQSMYLKRTNQVYFVIYMRKDVLILRLKLRTSLRCYLRTLTIEEVEAKSTLLICHKFRQFDNFRFSIRSLLYRSKNF